MTHFEHLMGFVLMGTAGYLFMILPPESKNAMAIFLIVLALSAYLWGKFGGPGVSKIRRQIIRIAALGIAALGAWGSQAWLINPALTYVPTYSNAREWKPFSYSSLFEGMDQKRITLVDFTADWCPNCKWVESTVLHDKAVLEEIRKRQIRLLVADITRPDPEKQRLLETLGSQSIPFLAFFYPGENKHSPSFLRDIYSVEEVIAGIKKHP